MERKALIAAAIIRLDQDTSVKGVDSGSEDLRRFTHIHFVLALLDSLADHEKIAVEAQVDLLGLRAD